MKRISILAVALASLASAPADETAFYVGHHAKFVNITFESQADIETIIGTTNVAKGTIKADLETEVGGDVEGAAGSEGLGLGYAVVVLFGFTFALPVLSIMSSFPGGLISAAIIAFGMHQAWKMTATPQLAISGPYRVGAAAGDPRPTFS